METEHISGNSSEPPESILWKTALVMVLCITVAVLWYSGRSKPMRFQDACLGANTELGIDSRRPHLGRWTGKWDDTWAVEFDVTDDPNRNGFLVVYRWEEQVNQPKRDTTFLACLNNNMLVDDGETLTLKIDETNPNAALLIGAFSRHTRHATMTRSGPFL